MPTPWIRPLSSPRRISAAVVTGFALAALVHLLNLIVLFAANGSSAANLPLIHNFFFPMSLVLFVLLAVAAGLGALRRWWIALPTGRKS